MTSNKKDSYVEKYYSDVPEGLSQWEIIKFKAEQKEKEHQSKIEGPLTDEQPSNIKDAECDRINNSTQNDKNQGLKGDKTPKVDTLVVDSYNPLVNSLEAILEDEEAIRNECFSESKPTFEAGYADDIDDEIDDNTDSEIIEGANKGVTDYSNSDDSNHSLIGRNEKIPLGASNKPATASETMPCTIHPPEYETTSEFKSGEGAVELEGAKQDHLEAANKPTKVEVATTRNPIKHGSKNYSDKHDRYAWDSYKEQVKDAFEITDIAERVLGIELKRSGSAFRCKAPWRDESEPSVYFYPATQSFFDFGEHVGGDVFELVMKKEGYSFKEALDLLAREAGISPPRRWTPEQEQKHKEKYDLFETLRMSAEYYHKNLTPELREKYFHSRGINDDTINAHGLGYAKAGGQDLWHYLGKKGISEEDRLKTGLFIKTSSGIYDFYQGRLIFPYYNGDKVVYFNARETDKTPDKPWEKGAKYKKLLTHNEKHPRVSEHIKNDTIYNINDARGNFTIDEPLIITEGPFDVLSASQAGFRCISPGTASFKDDDLTQLIALLGKKKAKVVICNDSDKAGIDGTIKTARELYSNGINVFVAALPTDGEKVDINSFIQSEGEDKFQQVIGNAKGYDDYLIADLPKKLDWNTLSDQLKDIVEAAIDYDELKLIGFAEKIAKHYGLKNKKEIGKIEGHLKKQIKEKKKTANSKTDICESSFGFTQNGCYFKSTEKFPKQLTDWTFNLTMRYENNDNNDKGLIADLIPSDNGEIKRNVTISERTWASRGSLMAILPQPKFNFFGNDSDVQILANIIKNQVEIDKLPIQRVTTMLGVHQTSSGRILVTPEGCVNGTTTIHFCDDDDKTVIRKRFYDFYRFNFSEESSLLAEKPPILYLTDKNDLEKTLRYKAIGDESTRTLCKLILSYLWHTNKPRVLFPCLGWFGSLPFRHEIYIKTRLRPCLWLYGGRGAGKTSLVRLLCSIFGGDITPNNSDVTPASLRDTLSASTTKPATFDEFNKNLKEESLNVLIHVIKLATSDGIDKRGTSDNKRGGIVWKLIRPFIVMGESLFTKMNAEGAISDRTILTVLRDVVTDEKPYCTNFDELDKLNDGEILGILGQAYDQFCLGIIFENVWNDANRLAEMLLKGEKASVRCKKNIIATLSGFLVFRTFSITMGVTPPLMTQIFDTNGKSVDFCEGEYFLREIIEDLNNNTEPKHLEISNAPESIDITKDDRVESNSIQIKINPTPSWNEVFQETIDTLMQGSNGSRDILDRFLEDLNTLCLTSPEWFKKDSCIRPKVQLRNFQKPILQIQLDAAVKAVNRFNKMDNSERYQSEDLKMLADENCRKSGYVANGYMHDDKHKKNKFYSEEKNNQIAMYCIGIFPEKVPASINISAISGGNWINEDAIIPVKYPDPIND